MEKRFSVVDCLLTDLYRLAKSFPLGPQIPDVLSSMQVVAPNGVFLSEIKQVIEMLFFSFNVPVSTGL